MSVPDGVTAVKVNQDAASNRFTDVASEWDKKPSTVAATDAMSATIKNMAWFTNVKKSKGKLLRAMDFGCGTGLLTYKMLDSEVFYEVVGVDVSDGMINAFEQKIKSNKSKHNADVKLTAVHADLYKTDLARLNSMVGWVPNPGDHNGFDIVYTLLAFHHIKEPQKMLNEVLMKRYLNPGGRIVVMDYEHELEKQIFHPVHLKMGVHYEHDGFNQSDFHEMFEKGNAYPGFSMEQTNKASGHWDISTFQIKKVPYFAPVDPDYLDLIPKRTAETYTMLVVSCCTNKRDGK